MPIEVETRSLQEVRDVLALLAQDRSIRVDRIMLDNMAKLDPLHPGAASYIGGVLQPVHAPARMQA